MYGLCDEKRLKLKVFLAKRKHESQVMSSPDRSETSNGLGERNFGINEHNSSHLHAHSNKSRECQMREYHSTANKKQLGKKRENR
jgi:hypothetical protein